MIKAYTVSDVYINYLRVTKGLSKVYDPEILTRKHERMTSRDSGHPFFDDKMCRPQKKKLFTFCAVKSLMTISVVNFLCLGNCRKIR